MSVKRIGLWAVAATALALSFFSAPLAAAEVEPVAQVQARIISVSPPIRIMDAPD